MHVAGRLRFLRTLESINIVLVPGALVGFWWRRLRESALATDLRRVRERAALSRNASNGRQDA
jgi:hypothetical protein